MSVRTRIAAITCLLCAPAIARAQTVSQTYQATRSATGTPRLTVSGSGTLPGGPGNPLIVAAGGSLELTFDCDAGVDCAAVSVASDQRIGMPFTATTGASATRATVVVSAAGLSDTGESGLTVRFGSDAVQGTLRVQPTDSQQPRSFENLLLQECRTQVPAQLYDAAGDSAQFVVTPLGNVLARPRDPIDENDLIVVSVVGAPDVLKRIQVRRTSAFRSVGGIQVVGLDTQLAGLIRQSTGGPPTCEVRRFELADFASGRGEVEIALVTDGDSKTMGTFDFAVHPLYSGAFTFGPIVTALPDQTFQVLPDSTVALRRTGDTRGEYVVAYTHFIWGRRDLDKPTPRAREHVNPFVALVLDDPLDNVLVGLSLDMLNGSVYLHAGVHGGRYTRLDPDSGLQPGAKVGSSTAELPLQEPWVWKGFAGLTVDLRVASAFLGKVVSGG